MSKTSPDTGQILKAGLARQIDAGVKSWVLFTAIAFLTLGVIGAGLPHRDYLSCTAFMIRNDEGAVTGKNLDWPVGLGAVLYNPAGVAKKAWVHPPEEPATWVANYSSVTLNQFGREFPLGGMNSAGLVVEELSYWPARYPDRDERPAVNELQWIQFQLDNYGSVHDVLQNVSSLRIAPFLFGLHYLVTDASGQAAIIEYLDGRTVVYTAAELPIVVLTNDSYENLLRQLRQYVGFGGPREAGLGSHAPERFVRAATRVAQFEASVQHAPVDSAFALLDDVAQYDTQWSIVYDPSRLAIHFRTREHPPIRSLRLSDHVRECDAGVAGFRIRQEDVLWNKWTLEDNETLLGEVFRALETTGTEIPSAERQINMAQYSETVTCAF